jgi:hypothetical protein
MRQFNNKILKDASSEEWKHVQNLFHCDWRVCEET